VTRRWAVLGAFSLLVASTQLLWLSFAPVTTQVHAALGVSEGAVGDLAGLAPLLYVVLAIPCGRWTDRRFGAALACGAVLTAGGATLRAAVPTSYPWVLAGQVIVSVGQPLVLNATTKVAARYFPLRERTTAIAVGSAAQFVGILVAASTGGSLLDAGGLAGLLRVHAAVSVVAALGVLLALRVPAAFAGTAPPGGQGLGSLRRDPVLWALAGLLFIGVGVFNALATWLDAILGAFGLPGASGTLITTTTVAGIIGAAVLPGVAARHDRRRTLLLVTVVTILVTFPLVAAVHQVVAIGILLAVLGFVLLAGLPVALDWSELHVGPERAGTATGLLLLAGNLGGAVLVLAVQAVLADPYVALGALAAAGLPGLALVALLPARVGHPEERTSPAAGMLEA